MENKDKIYTILLVDDEAGIRNVLDITLTHAGFKVLLASDGDKGLKTFKTQKPDIVITDIKMPGIDGIELLKQIKQISPDTEVIMITGHGDMDFAVKSLQYGATDFITKPIDSTKLELSVKKAVDRISILSLDLLNYAKTSRLKLKPINPNDPARELATLLNPRAIEKEIKFNLSPLNEKPDEKLSILMDNDAVYNALFNLVTNAFDAFDTSDVGEENSENRGDRTDKEVTLFVEKEQDWIVFRIEDNGEGMDENISQSLFKDFITTKGAHGTGFGLMTTKKIIDEHNGLIFFKTEKGRGSVFTMKIPLQQPEERKG